MRHGKKFNHLGRKKAHREAMLSNMAVSLIMHKRIKTTVAKAKALRVYVEPLITRSKEDSTNSRRVVFRYLQSKDAVTELFREVSVKIMDRPGGYTRILKTGARLGDNADMCIIELVDYNEHLLDSAQETKAKTTTRRSRRGGSKKTDEVATPVAEVATVEVPEVEAAVIEEVAEEVSEEVAEEVVEEVVEKSEEKEVVEEIAEEAPAEEAEVKSDDVKAEEDKSDSKK